MKKVTIKTIIAFSFLALDLLFLFFEPLADITVNKLPELKLMCIMAGVLSVYYGISALDREDQAQSLSDDMKLQTGGIRSMVGIFSDSKSFLELNEVEKCHGLDSNENGNKVIVITSCLQEANPQDPNGKEFLKTIYLNIAKHDVEYYYIIPTKLKSEFEAFVSLLRGQAKKSSSKEAKNQIFVSFDEKIDVLFPSEYFDVNIYVDTTKEGNATIPQTAEGYYCFSSKSSDNSYLYLKMTSEKAKDILSYIESQKFEPYCF